MSERLKQLIHNNQQWAKQFEAENPGFFAKLAAQQSPDYLWIGCADSRVPANTIIGLDPGEVFVHRNVANIVNHADFNVLSVLEYAINVLQVKDIIVCGHYGCGGVQAAMSRRQNGLVDNWLRPIRDIYRQHEKELEALDETQRFARMCELNVMEQVQNVCRTSIVQSAWQRNQTLSVHGVIYGLNNGLLKDLEVTSRNLDDVDAVYHLLHP